MLMTR